MQHQKMKIKLMFSNNNETVNLLDNPQLHQLLMVVENHLADQEQEQLLIKAVSHQEIASVPVAAGQPHILAKL